MVYCDENSEVVNKTIECTSTKTPEVVKLFHLKKCVKRTITNICNILIILKQNFPNYF